MNDILTLSALELARKIKDKQLTVSDAVLAVYQRISERESSLHCYITIRDRSDVLIEAEQIQKRIDTGELNGPLAGVPIAIKDNICTKDLRTTCASRILENFTPPYSATVIKRLKDAGMIIIGKTNMDEFGMGSTTESSAFGITRNPYQLQHSPGGSSGGSCAAVAAGEAFLALGSDTGGSVRQPAAHCGLFGMKPTYGAVSRYGLIAYASSFDQIGPIGKTAEDCKALLDIISGHDPKDATSLPKSSCTTGACGTSFATTLNNSKIGIPDEFFPMSTGPEQNSLSPAIRQALQSVIDRLPSYGAEVSAFSFGSTAYFLPAYYIIACSEASSNLARYDGVKYGYRSPSGKTLHDVYCKTRSEAFGHEVKKRILLGTFALSAGFYDDFYRNALNARNRIVSHFDEIFSKYDFLLFPATADTAPLLSAYASDPIAMYQSDLFTVPANLAGLPAITIPVGTDSSGLPLGVQLVGKRGSDTSLLQAASLIYHQGEYYES